jgi:hypothetical protein
MITTKQILTERRSKRLRIVNGSIDDLEREYGKYCYVPLDIPVYSRIHHVAEWFEINKKPIVKPYSDISSGVSEDPAFDSVDVSFYTPSDARISAFSKNLVNSFWEDFPDFKDYVMDNFPFERWEGFKFWSSRRPIIVHRDEVDFNDLCTSFRILVKDENSTSTLTVAEWLPDQATPCQTINVTNVSGSSMMWNNLRTQHYSTHDMIRRKILCILHPITIDGAKYQKLIERSISKFKHECLISGHTINDYIDG